MRNTLLFTFFLLYITINGQNKIESSVEEHFNGAIWENFLGTNYAYDNNNNLLSATIYTWSGSAWEVSEKEVFNYNQNNDLIEIIDQSWDGSQFENTFRTVFTYVNGNITQTLYQDWDGLQWVNTDLETYTYTGNNITQVLGEEWNGSQWINFYRETLSYSGNNITQNLGEDWDGSQWVNDSRETFTYNVSNQRTIVIYDIWNGSSWDEEERINYDLDGNGNRIRETYMYNGSIQDKTEYAYGTGVLLSSLGHPFINETGIDFLYEDFPHINKVLSKNEFDYDSNSSSYNQTTRTSYDYNSPLTLSSNKVTLNEIKIYPNPSDEFLNITGITNQEQIAIYNILGNAVSKHTIYSNESISIKDLATGIYFLKFKSGDLIKFIKK